MQNYKELTTTHIYRSLPSTYKDIATLHLPPTTQNPVYTFMVISPRDDPTPPLGHVGTCMGELANIFNRTGKYIYFTLY
jgi:hypothetical protein